MEDIIDVAFDPTSLQHTTTLAYAKDAYEHGLSAEEVILTFGLPEDFDFSIWEVKDLRLGIADLDARANKPNIKQEDSEEAILEEMLIHRKFGIKLVGKMFEKLDRLLGQEMTVTELSIAATTHGILLKAVTPEAPKGGMVVNNIGTLANYAQAAIANADKDC